ncbi:MAG: hypothetical protein Q8R02_15445 [Hyphomonadaceae bacterium]|nr:hypothetical protein [Hyphomonadaceae bacterium]
MNRLVLRLSSALFIFGFAGLAEAQAPDVKTSYAPPRAADGHPDLQGTWTNASITTLERADRYKSTVLTPDEVEKATLDHPQLVRMRTEDIANTPATGLLTGKDLLAGRGYNAFWIDPGTRFGVVKGETRTAWITDPPSGKIPYSEAGKKLARAGEAKLGYSDPESRPLPDRCLATGGRTGPPMINGLYNNHYQIVQTPGYVMVHTEMISHARVIPLRREHETSAATIHPLFGDSVGWWEGDKLVIETTNFNPYHEWQDHPAYLSAKAKVIEKFSRVSDKELLYEFTVEDPAFYAQPWKGEITYWNDGERIYEYACHEGNYAMEGILQGARVREAKGLPLDQANDE